ncbi:MAG: nucleotidyltransferase family protein [Acidobacteriia bacterium]|nr:nucleotidyltransferase family protein [Terriglobia bacterium]
MRAYTETVRAVISDNAYDEHVDQLFEVLHRVTSALRAAGIDYRVVGGVAVFLHISERDPLAARMTRDIDLAVNRGDLDRIAEALRPFGFEFRHTAGVDMLVVAANPRGRSAVHLLMFREKVRPEYAEAVPDFSPPVETRNGVLLAAVADLVRMKLTSYRLKDRVHVQDLDAAGLITPEIEGGLPEELRRRLAETRAAE